MEYKTEKTVTYTCTGSWNLEDKKMEGRFLMEDTKNLPKTVSMERKNLPRKMKGGYIDLPEGLDDIMRSNIRKTLVEIDEKFPGIDFIDLEYLYITAIQGELFWYKSGL